MTSTIESAEEIQNEIVDGFSFFDSWDDRYKYVIELGEKQPVLPTEFKTDEYKVRGCQSQVWIYPQIDNGVVKLVADSDTPTVKGLVSLLLKIYGNRTPAEILTIEPDFIDRSGLSENLSSLRVNGMRAAAKQIKKYAKAYIDTKSQSD